MRPLMWVLCVLSVLTVAFMSPKTTARADATQDLQQELDQYVQDNLSALNMDDFEQFCARLGVSGSQSVRATLAGLMRGELTVTPRELLGLLWDAVASAVGRTLPAMAVLVLIGVLFNLLSGLTQNFLKPQTTHIVHFVCYAAMLLTVMAVVADALTTVRRTVDDLTQLMNVVTPPLMTLMVAVGGQVTSAVFRPQLALMCTLVANVIAQVVLPLFVAAVVFAVVGNLSDNVRLTRLQSATRYIIGVVLGSVFGLFATYLSVAGLAGSMADTVSIRTARYVISSYLPLVGGYISQGFDLVTASVGLIKNALGVYAVLVVLAVVLAPMVQMLALVVGLKLTAGILQPVGDKRMASFVGEVGECMRSLLAAVAGVGFTFMVSLLLVMCSTMAVL